MKKLLIILIALVLCIILLIGVIGLNDRGKWRPVAELFQYDPARIDVGNVYHYQVSDIAGNNPMDAFVYVKSPDTLVVYKDFSKLYRQVYIITYTMDWDHMMRKSAIAYNPLNNHKLPNVELKTEGYPTDFARKKLKIKSVVNDENGKTVVNTLLVNYRLEPCFDYSFYHFDLQFAFRFLQGNAQHFMIGNTFAADYADTKVSYIKDEPVNGTLCKKYEIRSLGILAWIFNAKGYVWLARDDPRHYAVKYTNYLQRTSFWKDFMLELKDIQPMTPGQWEEFINNMVDKTNKDLNLI